MSSTEILERNYFQTNELQPTDENIIATLHADKFGRNNYVKFFSHLLDNIDYNGAIAVDGQWGCGKTFFVKQTIAILQKLNNSLKIASDFELPVSCIPNLEHSFLPIYYDAWENDNVNDPILSLIHTIISNENVDRKGFLIEKPKFLKKMAALTDMISGKGICELWEKIEKQDVLNSIDDTINIKSEIKEFLENCIKGKADRMVIFIDELDRCKPDFAVKMLERIKHYFTCEKVTFVISVNSSELIHTIKSFYGDEFDACRYLDRFIDFRVELPDISIEEYVSMMNFDINMVQNEVAIELAKLFKMTIRETEKYFRSIKAASGKFYDDTHFNTLFDNQMMFFYLYILPVMLGLKMTDLQGYNNFISGENFEILKKVIIRRDSLDNVLNLMSRNPEPNKEWETIESVYKYIFSDKNRFYKYCLEIAGLISYNVSHSYGRRR